VLHFEQRISCQRECSLEKEKGKSARERTLKVQALQASCRKIKSCKSKRDPAGNLKIEKSRK
jgi:hypothetical protein